MILVIGGIGEVSRHVMRELATVNSPFRVLAQSQAEAKALRAKGIAAMVADVADVTSIQTALEEVERVFLLLPNTPESVSLERGLLAEAVRARVHHVVRLSVIGANRQAAAPILRWHGRGEEQLENSGIAYTHLRANWFMQDMLAAQIRTVTQDGTVYHLHDEAQISLVDKRDIGSVAARILTEPGHLGRTYEVTGHEALSFGHIAEKLAAHLGRPITHSRLSDAMAWQNMVSEGMPARQIHSQLTLFQFHRQGGAALVTGYVEILTGRPARRLDDLIAENIQQFSRSIDPHEE